jgi:hypothetical protein
VRGARARCRYITTIRYARVLLGAIGVIGAIGVAAVTTAAPALAGVGSEPGNLRFDPAGGATSLTPTWSTTDGCPAGYRGSAQMSIFTTGGRFLSSISNVAYNVTGSFKGTLDGTMSAILRFANVHNGGSLQFVVGCYSQIGGTGTSRWLQSTVVTLSSDGNSYTTSTPSGQQGSTSGGQAGGISAANSAGGAEASNASAAGTHTGSDMSALAVVALVAAACALVAGTAGYIWHRRRDRSRLM